MRIAVNTRALHKGELEDYGFFIEEIFSRIICSYPEHEFYFISDRPRSFEFFSLLNVREILIKPLSNVNRINNSWFSWRLSSLLKKIHAHVLISIYEISSPSTNIPECLIVQDVHFLHLTKTQEKRNKRSGSNKFSKVTYVFTPSETIEKNIEKEFRITENNIQVILHPASTLFQPVKAEIKEKIKMQFTEGTEYFIYKYLDQSGKNVFTLLKAFSAFKKKQKSNMKLLIAVNSKTQQVDLVKQLTTYKYREAVKIIEISNKQLLANLVAGSYALIDLSGNKRLSYSAFEAIQCQTAAIISKASFVSEKERDAILFVNNNSFEDVAEKMILLYKDESLRTKLIENGGKIISFISWDEAAKKVWNYIPQTSVS